MGVLVRNLSEADNITDLKIPTRPDGTYYRYEMIVDGGWSRYYDDDPTALIAFLIPDYETLDQEGRLAARIRHAVDLQVRLQARLNIFFSETDRSDAENQILMASRTTPPAVTDWTCDVPLVLVDAFYTPHGNLPRPDAPQPRDEDDLPTLWWLRPAEDELEYLRSLHDSSLIDLNINTDEVA